MIAHSLISIGHGKSADGFVERGPAARFECLPACSIHGERRILEGATVGVLRVYNDGAALMNPDSFVAVYSAGKDCGLAAQAAQRLENLRLTNVHYYEDGLEGWQAAGLPVVESVLAKVHARGPVHECRPIVVDTEHAYGGAFKNATLAVDGAGG